MKYRHQHGRRYHSYKADEGVNYMFPNDDEENKRLDLQHHIMALMQGGQLYLSPAGKDGRPFRRVLDVGTGTGLWATELGDANPKVHVIGNDLSPIQPTFTPPNVEFFVDDVEEDWDYSHSFDFIYIRNMTGSIKNWPKLLDQAYDALRPGGWIELCDPINPVAYDDGSLAKDSPLLK